MSVFDQFAARDVGRELQGMSELLDVHPVLLDFVAEDLGSSAATGRCGLTAESALPCARLKQYRLLTYEERAFHLLGSASFQAFAGLPLDWIPKKAALQVNIAAITDTAWRKRNAEKRSAEKGSARKGVGDDSRFPPASSRKGAERGRRRFSLPAGVVSPHITNSTPCNPAQ